MINRKELRKKLPHGYCTTIARKAGVTRATVSNYFNGKYSSSKVEITILQELATLEQEKNKLLSQING